MIEHLFEWQNVVHVGAVLYLICFTFRNQLYLRIFAILGEVCYTTYFFAAADKPLWGAIFWSSMNMAINLFMIALIFRDTRQSFFNDDELNLFRNLPGLSPGQFRKLMKIGKWTRTAKRDLLTEEGKALDRLHYVLDGKVNINKSGREIKIKPTVFIGELAFLRQKPATATVHVEAESLYVTWAHDDLHRAMNQNEELRTAFALLLNNDMAEKMART